MVVWWCLLSVEGSVWVSSTIRCGCLQLSCSSNSLQLGTNIGQRRCYHVQAQSKTDWTPGGEVRVGWG